MIWLTERAVTRLGFTQLELVPLRKDTRNRQFSTCILLAAPCVEEFAGEHLRVNKMHMALPLVAHRWAVSDLFGDPVVQSAPVVRYFGFEMGDPIPSAEVRAWLDDWYSPYLQHLTRAQHAEWVLGIFGYVASIHSILNRECRNIVYQGMRFYEQADLIAARDRFELNGELVYNDGGTV